MEVVLMPTALEDVEFWKKSGNIQIQKRISALLEAMSVNTYEGTGKPEKLKYEYWSRRINTEHRIVYTAVNSKVYIIACRYHYN
jgi:toxin YoeB